jgi:uncharacterized tellurite resistance protein B-like protein
MRCYPTDSPEAAARLLAMALVADGHYAISEIKALDRLSAPARLGLTPEAFKQVIDHFCEDLLLASHGEWLGSAAIDAVTRSRLFGEVQNAALGAEVRALCEAVMLSDGHLADGETALLDELARAWPHTISKHPSASPLERLAV